MVIDILAMIVSKRDIDYDDCMKFVGKSYYKDKLISNIVLLNPKNIRYYFPDDFWNKLVARYMVTIQSDEFPRIEDVESDRFKYFFSRGT